MIAAHRAEKVGGLCVAYLKPNFGSGDVDFDFVDFDFLYTLTFGVLLDLAARPFRPPPRYPNPLGIIVYLLNPRPRMAAFLASLSALFLAFFGLGLGFSFFIGHSISMIQCPAVPIQ